MQPKETLGRRFWRLWSAVTISSLGDGMLEVALPFLALSFTRNPIAISAVWIVQLIPELLIAVPAGTLADRLNRRSMIVSIEAARFLVVGAFGLALLFHSGSLALLLATAFVLGGLNMGFDVACGASLPCIVTEDSLVRANAHLMNAELTSENLVGQAIGGAALAVARWVPFLGDAVIFAASGVLASRAVPDNETAVHETSAWRDSQAGLRWFFKQPTLRLLTAVMGSLAFCQAIVLGVLPLYAREKLNLGGTGYGLLLAVASIGVVLGGIAAPRLHSRLGTGPMIFVAGLLAAGVYPVLAATSSPIVAAGVLMAESVAIICGNVVSRSLRQKIVPNDMQGRAGSAFVTVLRASQPLGALLGGVLASGFGMSRAFLIAAGLQVFVLALAGPLLIARVRDLGSSKSAKQRIIQLLEMDQSDPFPVHQAHSKVAS